MKYCKSKIVGATAVAFILSGLTASAAEAKKDSGWEFGASIYGWFPDIAGDTAAGGVEVDIDQILENLEFAMMGTFEARKGSWGVVTDVIYMDVQGKAEGPVAEDQLDMTSWVWNLAGSYRVLEKPAFVMDVIGGVRLLDVEQTLTRMPAGGGAPSSGTVELTNWDAIAGVRGRLAVGSKKALFFPYELDIGTGDSDLTAQAVTGLGYSFGWWELAAVWRYIYYDFPSDSAIENLSFSGPAAGVIFHW